MLCSLLFSSTAVYADTADNDVAASEVVVETGNTSNDTNSSTNLNDTVSGNDSIDDSNITTTDINTTEGDTSVEEEISEETNSSLFLESQSQLFLH